MTGNTESTTQKPNAAPILFMLLLCFVGGIATLLPWFDVEFVKGQIVEAGLSGDKIQQPEIAAILSRYVTCQAEAPSQHVDKIAWNPDRVYECHGLDLNMGFVSAVLCGSLGLLWLLTPQRFRLSVPVTAGAVILSTILFLSTLAARLEIQYVPFQLTPSSDVAVLAEVTRLNLQEWTTCTLLQDAESATVDSAEMAADSGLSSSGIPSGPPRTISPQIGYFLAIGVAASLLVLSGASLRSAVFDREHESPAGESRGDIVGINSKDISAGLLPDVCVVCGQHTMDRVQKSIQYQSKFAQACMLAGFILGGIPGVIIAIATVRDVPVPCPVCPSHRNHWSRLTLFASLGWLIPVLLGGIGFLLGLFATSHSLQPSWLAITGLVTGIVIGLATYLIPVIYLASTNVKCEQTSDTQITFSRVSSVFARAARGRKS